MHGATQNQYSKKCSCDSGKMNYWRTGIVLSKWVHTCVQMHAAEEGGVGDTIRLQGFSDIKVYETIERIKRFSDSNFFCESCEKVLQNNFKENNFTACCLFNYPTLKLKFHLLPI